MIKGSGSQRKIKKIVFLENPPNLIIVYLLTLSNRKFTRVMVVKSDKRIGSFIVILETIL